MQMDDMILVSIDDHMIEPPDMYKNHVPAKWADQAPKVVRNDRGRRRVGVPGRGDVDPVRHGRDRRLAARGVGLQPGCVLRAAARLLRRARAGPGHERQRRAGLDELPDDGRLQRADLHRSPATRRSRSSCCGPTTTGRSTSGARAYPGRFIPLGIVPMWDVELAVEEVHRVAAKGCRSISFLETPHVQGFPSFLSGYWDPMMQGAVRHQHGAVAAHRRRLRRHPAAGGSAGRPPHGAGLPDQRDHRPGPALRADSAAVPGPEGRAVRGRHRLDPLLLRPHRPPLHQPGLAARRRATSAARSRRRSSGSTSSPATSPTRPACCCATGSASTTSPGSATTRTPTPPGRNRRSSPGRSSRTPRCSDSGDPQDHLGERLPVLRLGPVQAHAEGAGDRRRAARAGRRRRHHPDVRARSGASATRPPGSGVL